MKVATNAEKKMDNPRMQIIYFLQCSRTSYPMKSQRKHFIVYIYVLKIDYGI